MTRRDAALGSPDPQAQERTVPVPARWTLHGLNNGAIFAATQRGVSLLPRAVSYAIGHAGTWLAWRMMRETREAVADNLAAVFPAESRATLERRALQTFRSYACDAIDFIRALRAFPDEAPEIFELAEPYRGYFTDVRSGGRGLILVTGHFGNWEVGSLLMRALDLPLTIVAMAESDPIVNRIRRDMRERLGVDTIEVRRSFDTALQIRRRLAQNEIVALLMDRHYGRDRVPVRLLGRDAWFLRTPLLMGQITGAPVLPCTIERSAPGRFTITPGPPIQVAATQPRDEALARAAQAVADFFEARIRARPHAWYHFYRYWDAQRDEYAGLTGAD